MAARRGISLLELLASLTLLVILLLLTQRMLSEFIVEPPRAARALETHAVLGQVLAQMEKDIRSAPRQVANADEARLIVDCGGGAIVYSQDNGLIRRCLSPADGGPDQDLTCWPLENGQMNWSVWKRGKQAYAVEVRTAVEVNRGGRNVPVLANSRVFFLDAGEGKP